MNIRKEPIILNPKAQHTQDTNVAELVTNLSPLDVYQKVLVPLLILLDKLQLTSLYLRAKNTLIIASLIHLVFTYILRMVNNCVKEEDSLSRDSLFSQMTTRIYTHSKCNTGCHILSMYRVRVVLSRAELIGSSIYKNSISRRPQISQLGST